MKSPRTTIVGILAVLVTVPQLMQVHVWTDVTQPGILIPLLVAVLGIVSKDSNVTGGTSAATSEAAVRVGVQNAVEREAK